MESIINIEEELKNLSLNTEEDKKEKQAQKEQPQEEQKQKRKPLIALSTTKTTKKTPTKQIVTTKASTQDLYTAIYELIEENKKLTKLLYALISIFQREVYAVTEELDDPILSKLPPKAKEVFIYIMEMANKNKKTIPSMSIMAKFNLTQEELFQIVNEINKVIQQYGFSIRFIELESEEEF